MSKAMYLLVLLLHAASLLTTTATPIQQLAALSPRQTIARNRIIFYSSGQQMIGYHYPPPTTTATGRAPVIVLAHGLGALQSGRLQPFAEQFAGAGYNAITFDYRYWGESSGSPRNIIDPKSQQDDYMAAVMAAKALPGVDGSRVVLWGTSLSGGHVLTLGGGGTQGQAVPGLAAVIAQAPHVNGARTIGMLPFASLPGLALAAVEDLGYAALGQEPLYVPTANATGQWGALTQEGALEGYKFIQADPPPPGNVFAARFIAQMPLLSPDLFAPLIRVPTFVGVAMQDKVTPPEPAITMAQRMRATLATYPGGHFDVYPGAPQYEAMIRDQLAFLRKNLPIS